MGRLSSKSFIKLHAWFQFFLAVYLTNSREVISDSELVRNDDTGLSIDISNIFTRPRSPFAYCGIILIVFAIFDLVLATKLPMLNQLIAISRLVIPTLPQGGGSGEQSSRNRNRNRMESSGPISAAINKATDEFKSLFTHICILLAVVRFCAFSLVARKIFASAPEVWRASVSTSSTVADVSAATRDIGARLEMAKMKVVLGYLYMEVMFSIWVIRSLLDERRQTESQLRFVQARVLRS